MVGNMGKNLINQLKCITRAEHRSSTTQSPFCACCPWLQLHGLGDKSHLEFAVEKPLV